MERAMLAEFERRDCYEWRMGYLERISEDQWDFTSESWDSSGISCIVEGPLSWCPQLEFKFDNLPYSLTYLQPDSAIQARAAQRALVAPIARQLAKRLHGVPFEEVAKFLY